MKILNLLGIIGLVFLFSCDYGIEPLPPESSGFSGRINYTSEWPDSVKRSFLVVFENPLIEPDDFTINNLKYLSREIPLGVQSHNFSSLDSAYIPPDPGPFPSGSYAFVALVQQSTENLSFARKDWFVSGVYYEIGDTTKPGTMVIPESTFIRNINIKVDFNNPPPQPPTGN
ncbi:MAG: hypothetical protein KJN64_05920 [Ignavibacteria bacterium]|nr:hypothetical protein [Ignavibacteria bacterium]MBT8390905.1 hypothetical protein [Ignavibacteria bacterium]